MTSFDSNKAKNCSKDAIFTSNHIIPILQFLKFYPQKFDFVGNKQNWEHLKVLIKASSFVSGVFKDFMLIFRAFIQGGIFFPGADFIYTLLFSRIPFISRKNGPL